MRHTFPGTVSAVLGVCALGVVFAAVPAQAEGDAPFFNQSSQQFDNNYATYKTNRGVSTNFIDELLPINPLGDDGRIKFESRDVPRPGTGAARLDDSRTGFQLDFNF